jgi:hypothetical protein
MGLGKEEDLDDPKTWHYWMAEMGHPRVERLYELRRDVDELKTALEGMLKVLENLTNAVMPQR